MLAQLQASDHSPNTCMIPEQTTQSNNWTMYLQLHYFFAYLELHIIKLELMRMSAWHVIVLVCLGSPKL